ncbi:MAG: dUTP diphosphatase [Candidatus Buchananbacteria bacterium]
MKLKFKKLKPDAVTPSYAHEGDAGLDLYALEDNELKPDEIKRIDFGFALEFPQGHVAIMKDRSSMGKNGIHNVGGVFDWGYRGEYNCTLINLSGKNYTIKKGDKVTQMLIFPIAYAEIEETNDLGDTSRSTGNFGSTGK